MVAVNEAKELIAAHIVAMPAITLPLADAGQLVLAADIIAPLDIPAYPQSSMDGYAFGFSGWQQGSLHVNGEMAAGDSRSLQVQPGQAVRIFTGAPVPPGADTVVMQEKTTVLDNTLQFTDNNIQAGDHVRPAGSEIKAGALAMPAGSLLTPAALGFLAGIGITEVPVYNRPRVCLLVTGNELQQPGRPLQYGQVYESNSVALSAALRQLGFPQLQVTHAPDNLATLQQTITQLLQQCDVLLVTGGVSVGEYDFVSRALAGNGVQQVFHRVKQRPGKPLYFGQKQQQYVFGLPGNPSSVLTCFYQYVLPALQQLMQLPVRGLPQVQAALSAAYRKNTGLTHFLKGHYANGTVTPLNAQESYRMHSFASANCLICLNETQTTFTKGEVVTVQLLP